MAVQENKSKSESGYKSLKELRNKIRREYKARNVMAAGSIVGYGLAALGANQNLNLILTTASVLITSALSTYFALESHEDARDLEKQYQLHLARNDLPVE